MRVMRVTCHACCVSCVSKFIFMRVGSVRVEINSDPVRVGSVRFSMLFVSCRFVFVLFYCGLAVRVDF